ncbi:hypothetical protein M011DRAFT_489571 [Sporormia fimetaria CBS 119925]|uniref:Glycerate dehydrogenase n=1 Tax=Sporormia fimetaria CBS 119925 TaxID=1340428 RepID=A0A6A6UZM3_9PLEO|nr:hypothetical protein M011DRAFT_489571 [Sporormia fimetaria CBS 119925]
MPTSPQPKQPLRLAILDDYHNLALPLFSHLSPQISLSTFPKTLPPYSHQSTSSTDREALVARLHPFDILICMRERTPLPGALLRRLPNLKIVFATGSKFDSFDFDTATELGIEIRCTGSSSTRNKEPVAAEEGSNRGKEVVKANPTVQHTWAVILSLAQDIPDSHNAIRSGAWQSPSSLGIPLYGKTLGILGLGNIGACVARIGVLAWGMRVICWSQNLTQDAADQKAREMGLPVSSLSFDGNEEEAAPEEQEKTFKVVTKEDLFSQSDVVSVHYTLSPRSRHIITHSELSLMKPTALFINTARAGLVEEDALVDLLKEGRIAGAALDVFDVEPLPKDSVWRDRDGWGSRVVCTPHLGFMERRRLEEWYGEVVGMVEGWLEGEGFKLHV